MKPASAVFFRIPVATSTRPLLITQWTDLELPYIAEIAGSTIMVDMVTDVTKNGKSPMEAATRAQQRAEQLITQLGYKKW